MSIALAVSFAAVAAWPSFRGPDASGVSDSAKPPVTWDIAAKRNVAWSTPIPGLGHSSPVVWGDRVFLTTAVPLKGGGATDGNVELKDGGSVGTSTPHAWRMYCLDRKSGRILWERNAHEGVPRVKRHSKASQASATPATDGKYVVAIMGSEGMYAWDMEGKLLWKKDLGKLDQGYVDDPTNEWSPGTSPIIHNGMLIVQNDRHKDSWVAAYDVATGAEKWRAGRDEMPSWSTPAVHRGQRTTIVTVSPKHIRGHDATTGKEIWSLPDGTQVKVVTPVLAGDLAIVTGGWPTAGRPIWAVRAATGEVVWKQERGSPYTPTPIVYRDILYVCVDNGVLSAYDVKTGNRLYQQRIANDSGGFSASAVAADGKLFFASEDGVVYVVRAGPKFELLASNDMGAMCLATPALTDELMLVRTTSHLHALRQGK